MGSERIKRNLKLDTHNVVDWCKQQILQANNIFRKGKNWYVTTNGYVFTVNSTSYSIITAHLLK